MSSSRAETTHLKSVSHENDNQSGESGCTTVECIGTVGAVVVAVVTSETDGLSVESRGIDNNGKL